MTLTGEAGAVQAVENFMASMKKDGQMTRSIPVSTSTKIGAVVKKSAYDYASNPTLRTRAGDANDVAVYEVALENDDNTQGFALVAEEDHPTVMAFTQVGSLADTTFNQGLAWWCHEMSRALTWTPPKETRVTGDGTDWFEDTLNDPLYYYTAITGSLVPAHSVFVSNVALLSTPNDALLQQTSFSPFILEKYIIPTNQWGAKGSPIRWTQNSPYNTAITADNAKDGSNAPVGCFGIAAASVICFWRYMPGDYSYVDWDGFQQWPDLTDPQAPALLGIEAAELCKGIAEDSGAEVWTQDEHGNAQGGTNASAVMNAFQNVFNYKITESYTGEVTGLTTTAQPMTKLVSSMHQQCIALMAGNAYTVSSSGWGSTATGHIWAVDGLYQAQRYLYSVKKSIRVVSSGGTMYSYDKYETLVGINMLHMVWGWNAGDGWYATLTPWAMHDYTFDQDVYTFTGIKPNI